MKPKLAASYRRAEEVRLIRRIQSLEVHRRGLDQAVEPFGGSGLDPQRWRDAFESVQPTDVVARNGVTGCYSAVINGYMELLKTGAYLSGLTPHKKDSARNTIECVLADGGINPRQADCLHELFVFEGRVEHASPDIRADEVREAVELLRQHAAALIESAVNWLERHEVVSIETATN